jgi:hypothetical protein
MIVNAPEAAEIACVCLYAGFLDAAEGALLGLQAAFR